MESKKDLVKIGHEGFAVLDEFYSRKGRQSAPPKPPTSHTSHYQYQPQKPKVYHVNPISRTERMVIHNQKAKPDLVQIGLEGFELLDKYYGKKPGPGAPQGPLVSSRPAAKQGPPKQTRYYQHQPEKPHVYLVKQDYATKEKVMNAYESAKSHGGVLIINRSN